MSGCTSPPTLFSSRADWPPVSGGCIWLGCEYICCSQNKARNQCKSPAQEVHWCPCWAGWSFPSILGQYNVVKYLTCLVSPLSLHKLIFQDTAVPELETGLLVSIHLPLPFKFSCSWTTHGRLRTSVLTESLLSTYWCTWNFFFKKDNTYKLQAKIRTRNRFCHTLGKVPTSHLWYAWVCKLICLLFPHVVGFNSLQIWKDWVT